LALDKNAKVLMTMTRWYPDDLGGRILDSGIGGEWTVLSLPARAGATADATLADRGGSAAASTRVPSWQILALSITSPIGLGWGRRYRGGPRLDLGQ